ADVISTVGWDRVLFGSDFPHPEGLAEPRGYYAYAEGMDEKRTRDFMGDNARRLLGLPVRDPAGDRSPVAV
ncbi:amidohydrolase family protein, partial [Frankia sp. AvcI1]